MTYVLDSWPLLEWLLDKPPAAERFEQFVDRAILNHASLLMSRMNYGEVVYSLAKKVPVARASSLLFEMKALPLTLCSVDDDLIDEAAALKSAHALSYADCFAAALAMRKGAPVVTGDAEFLKLRDRGLLRVEWMGA